MSLDISTTPYKYGSLLKDNIMMWVYQFDKHNDMLEFLDELNEKLRINKFKLHETHIDMETCEEKTEYYERSFINIYKDYEYAIYNVTLHGNIIKPRKGIFRTINNLIFERS